MYWFSSEGDFCLFPVFHREISRQHRLGTTIANSVDALHPRFCSSSCAFPFPKVGRCRHLVASKEILAFSDLCCTVFPGFHLLPPAGSGSRVGTGLLIQTSQG
ncbi:MAG: hypothetical protein DMG49_19555 [Acidobacteria bacterium]|nr:MAG: hypothetical protein DMG49_19555 [Acidobacteriota bacterium]